MSFVQVNGGGVVGVAYPSYLAYNITANLVLFWSTQFTDSPNTIAYIMDITSTAGLTVKLPDATQMSSGTTTFINNVGANSFDVLDFDGNVLATIAAGNSRFFYLRTNTTTAGVWGIANLPPGPVGVTSVAAVSTTPDIVITGSPITSAGTFTFSAASDLAAISALTTGIAVKTAASTWTTRSVISDVTNNIAVTNGSGVAGNITLGLSTILTGLVSINVGNLQLSGNQIISTNSNGNINLFPNQNGAVGPYGSVVIDSDLQILSSTPSGGGTLQSNAVIFYSSTGNTAHYISFQAGATTNAQSFLWPTGVPTAGQLLGYNSGNALDWFSVPTIAGSTSVNHIARYSNVSGSLKDSGIRLTDARVIDGDGLDIGVIISPTGLSLGTVNNQTISSSNDIRLLPDPTAFLVLDGTTRLLASASPRVLQFFNTANTQFAGLQANALLGSSITFILPASVGTLTKQIMITDAGSPAQLSFSSVTTDGIAKAWVRFDGTGADPIVPVNSYNTSGNVTKNGTGDYTININALSSANYAVAVGVGIIGGTGLPVWRIVAATNVQCRIAIFDTAGAAQDSTIVSVSMIVQ